MNCSLTQWLWYWTANLASGSDSGNNVQKWVFNTICDFVCFIFIRENISRNKLAVSNSLIVNQSIHTQNYFVTDVHFSCLKMLTKVAYGAERVSKWSKIQRLKVMTRFKNITIIFKINAKCYFYINVCIIIHKTLSYSRR